MQWGFHDLPADVLHGQPYCVHTLWPFCCVLGMGSCYLDYLLTPLAPPHDMGLNPQLVCLMTMYCLHTLCCCRHVGKPRPYYLGLLLLSCCIVSYTTCRHAGSQAMSCYRWLEAAQEVVDLIATRDGVLGSGGSIAPLSCGFMHSAMQLGLLQEQLFNVVQPALEQRCKAMCAALHEHLPQARFHEPDGGYFVWLQLPEQVCVWRMWARGFCCLIHHSSRTTGVKGP